MKICLGLVLGVLVIGAAGACGGSAASGALSPASPASAAPASAGSEAGPQMTIRVSADRTINRGRPLHVVVRAVDLNTYLQDSYAAVAAKVVTPDDSVIGQGVIYPGHDSTLKVPRPDKGAVAVYFLFTQPGAGWKTFIEQPLPGATALVLGNHGISGSKSVADEAWNPAAKGKGKKHGGRKVAVASGGVGVAGLLAGTAFGLLARSRWNQTSAYCNANNECTSQTGVDLGNQANTYGWIANLSFAVGVAGLASGATLWFMTPSSADKARGSQRKSAVIAGGVGAAGLVAGTTFGLLARSRWNQTSTYCSASGLCTSQTGIDLGNQARTYGWISNISFTVGVVGLVTGATLWFTAPSPAGKGARSATIAPLVGSDYAGASVRVRF